jgi:hypothetical protein
MSTRVTKIFSRNFIAANVSWMLLPPFPFFKRFVVEMVEIPDHSPCLLPIIRKFDVEQLDLTYFEKCYPKRTGFL